MKKKLNGKITNIKKKIISIIIILIFLLFTSLSLALSNRNYFFIEKFFKSLASYTNHQIVKRAYKNKLNKNLFINNKISYLQEENNELRSVLDLKTTNPEYEISEVINHLEGNWFNTLEINKGSRCGIKKDLPVINNLGLVGFVSKTGKDVSEVRLLTNVNSNNLISVVIKAETNDVSGVLSSYSNKKGLFKVKDVMNKNITLLNTPIKSLDSNTPIDAFKVIYGEDLFYKIFDVVNDERK